MEIDQGGSLHILWQDNSGGYFDIYYRKYSASALWSVPRYVPETVQSLSAPDMKMDSTGKIHIVWHDNTSGHLGIYYSRYDGLAWSPSASVAGTSASLDAPAMNMDSTDKLHLVWRDGTIGNRGIHYSRYDGLSWSTPARITGTSISSIIPAIEIDFADNPHVVWEDNASGVYEIYYSKYNGISWSPPANISGSSVNSSKSVIEIDKMGYINVLWQDSFSGNSGLYHSTYFFPTLAIYPFTTDPAPTWTYTGFTHDPTNKLMNANAVNGTLTSPEIDASSPDNTYYTTVYLKLKHLFAPKAGGLLDTAKIEISYYDTATTSWSTWTTVLQMTENTGPASKDLHLNLSKWAAGRKFKIRFDFSNGAGEGSWKIDDVEIRASKYSFVYRP